MRSRRWVLLVAVVLAAPLSGQSVCADVPLGPGLPVTFVGDTFASADAVAVADPTAIHLWTQVPSKTIRGIVPLPAHLRMAAAWRRLEDGLAAYDAVGADLLPGTADDELVLVTGLPAAPTLIQTAVTDLSAGELRRVDSKTLVSAAPGGFHLLRHDGGLVTRDWVPVPGGLALGGWFGFGPAVDGAVFALGLGQDGLAGTIDDVIVVLRDATSPSGRQPYVTEHALPAYMVPGGFGVTDEGVGVVWRPLVLPNFEYVEVRVSPWTPNSVDFGAAQVVWTPAASIPPWLAPSYGAHPTRGGGFLLWNDDDLGPGTGCVLLAPGAFGLEVAGMWYDDWNSGTWSKVLFGRDVATVVGMDPAGFQYQRYAAGGVRSLYSWGPEGASDLVRPNAGVVAAFGMSIAGWPGPITAGLTVVLDVFGQSRTADFESVGTWCGGDGGGPRVFALGAGRVAGFLDSSGSFGVAPDLLRIVETPIAVLEELPLATGWPYEVHLSFADPIPAMGDALVLGLQAPLDAESALVGFAWQRGTPFETPNIVGMPIHLDLGTLFGAALLPVQDGRADLSIPTSALPSILCGVPIWVQAVVARPGFTQTSELGLIVLGGGSSWP